jgi:erythromycin esterase
MNGTVRLFAALALAVALTGTAGADAANLAVNGGFEKGLDGWKTQNQGGTLKAEVDRKTKKEGKASGHVVKTGAFAADWLCLPVDKVPGGAKITVSAWVKGNNVGNCWLKFFVFDKSGRSVVEDCDIQMLRGSFDWKKIERPFTLPKEAVRAELRLCLFTAGEVWIDDVRVGAKGAKPPRDLDKRTRKWLDKNGMEIATLDFDASDEDLAGLARTLAGVRIVQLGESSHGDGATQKAKARLVRFLHEKMGFEVLAFESGLYECERANSLLVEGKPREAMKASIFGIWRLKEVEPLFEYMAKNAKSKSPLVLSGFDPQASGGWSDRFLDDLAGKMKAAGAGSDDALEAVKALLPELEEDEYRPDNALRQKALAALTKVKAELDANREALVAKHGESEVAFLDRCLGNFEIYEKLRAMGRSGGRWESGNLRDGRMGENLEWLAEVRYPGKKIITWAATFHQAHNLKSVSIGGNARFYSGCRAMGEIVHEAFGKACYTIGFCSYEGTAGRFGPRGNLDEPAEGSIEDTLQRYGKGLLFLNLRKSGPFDKKLCAGVMAHGRKTAAKWSKVLDGLIYIEEMTSTTYMGND